MEENTHRFSGDQQVSDITMLLWKLGSMCIASMQNLLHGTDWKHGYLDKEERIELLDLMMDLAQELGIEQEEIAASWIRVEQQRKDSQAWGKDYVEKHGE